MSSGGPAVVFTNGTVHTVDVGNAIAEAVAVENDRIVAVGSNADALAWSGPATRRIDLRGRSLTPGFIDAHHHLTWLGSAQDSIDCKAPGMQSIASIVEALGAEVARTPPGAWIRGVGYDQSRLAERRHPNRFDLDPVSPDHPVVFTRTCGHIVAVNSRALALANLALDTPDPEGGRFDRDANGELTGVCYERAMTPVNLASTPTSEEIRRWLKLANDADLASGLTSIHEAGQMTNADAGIAQDLYRNGELKIRTYNFTTIDAADHPHLGILDTGYHSGLGTDRFRIGAFKVMTDGSSSGPTAATREPYASDPSTSGIAYWQQAELDDLLARAHRAGWQCTVHAVGDRAIEMTLDAMEAAQRAYPREGLRHRIEHCGITPPDLRDRIARLGIVPAIQPAFFWEFGDGYIRNYGRERADVMFRARSFLDRGVVVAGSSDAPVTDQRPLFGVEQAMTRATSDGDVCGPDERVDLDTALRMHTVNGAYASFEEGLKGSIEVGKLADLVVVSEDLRRVPVKRLRDVPIDMTFVGGELVYERW
jgi:predicted amidohydrolase YtcJ